MQNEEVIGEYQLREFHNVCSIFGLGSSEAQKTNTYLHDDRMPQNTETFITEQTRKRLEDEQSDKKRNWIMDKPIDQKKAEVGADSMEMDKITAVQRQE